MPFIQLRLAHSSQKVTSDASGSKRSLTFLGKVYGEEDELNVTRDGPQFDARLSRWIVSIFDENEQPPTELYKRRKA
jgi:hypothetical protein